MIIYHSNDVHGHAAELQHLLKKHRGGENSSMWLDSGDALLGSNTVFRLREPVLALMSALGCSAMAMGNREFNYLRRVMRLRSRQRSFPLLCANLRDLRGYAPAWQETLTLHTDEGDVTLIGATPVQYVPGSFWEKIFGFRFLDPLTVLPSLAQDARRRGDAVVILSHLGLDTDKRLAALLPPGTLILGGHTHTVLAEPVQEHGYWIGQGGSRARYLVRLDYDASSKALRRYELLS